MMAICIEMCSEDLCDCARMPGPGNDRSVGGAGRVWYDHSNDAETHDAGCQGDNQSGQDILPEHP